MSCLTEDILCNQFKMGSSIMFTYKNNNKTAVSDNVLLFYYNNFSDTTNINFKYINNKGFYESYDLLSFVFQTVIPPTLRRLFDYYFAYKILENDGRKFVRLYIIYAVESCTWAVYQDQCTTNKYVTSFGNVINDLWFDKDYTGITHNYIIEMHNGLDQVESDRLFELNDHDYKRLLLY